MNSPQRARSTPPRWRSKIMGRARAFARVLKRTKKQIKRLRDQCDADLAAQDVQARTALRTLFNDAEARVERWSWAHFTDAIEPWLRDQPPAEELERAATAAGCSPPLEHEQLRRREMSKETADA